MSSEEIDPSIQRSPSTVMSNGVIQTGEDASLPHSNSEKNQEHDHCTDHLNSTNAASNAEPETGNETNTENEAEQTTMRRGRKNVSTTKSTEPSESSVINEMETEKQAEHRSDGKDTPSSPPEVPSVEAAACSENEKETGVNLSSPKASENESEKVASQSPSGKLLDESRSTKASGRPKKKESSIKEAVTSADDISKEAITSADGISNKVSEGTSDSELKLNRRSGKKVPSEISNEDKAPTVVDAPKKEISDSEAKPLRQLAKKANGGSKTGDGSSSKQTEDKKRRGRGKAISDKDETKSSVKDDDKVLSYWLWNHKLVVVSV